jgi:hypothetical protein
MKEDDRRAAPAPLGDANLSRCCLDGSHGARDVRTEAGLQVA